MAKEMWLSGKASSYYFRAERAQDWEVEASW